MKQIYLVKTNHEIYRGYIMGNFCITDDVGLAVSQIRADIERRNKKTPWRMDNFPCVEEITKVLLKENIFEYDELVIEIELIKDIRSCVHYN